MPLEEVAPVVAGRLLERRHGRVLRADAHARRRVRETLPDRAVFIAAFRRHTGVTPTRWRATP